MTAVPLCEIDSVKVYSCVRLTTSSLVTFGGLLQSFSSMLILLWPIKNKVLYLEKIETRSCDTSKIEGVVKFTHPRKRKE